MTDKEKIECLSDLCRFLANHQEILHSKIWKAISIDNPLSSEKRIHELVMTSPIFGSPEKDMLRRIGEQPVSWYRISEAIELLDVDSE